MAGLLHESLDSIVDLWAFRIVHLHQYGIY